ncbi:hypothetical protein JQ543_02895 [Bradyrhizobium diazoefficiens]|nr:putative nucleotide-diphospho-sugar transferase [Bradyrhizobium diazoefficiens]MBR0846678.1 hypothetical protein [Bradyrhizobium diazoefficiens]
MTPVVAMLCTRGMEEFLANALSGMLRAGIAPAQIIIACPVDAEEAVRRVVGGHSPDIPVLPDALLPSTQDDQYAAFGSCKFGDISWAKIALIRRLIEQHEHLVYADLDIGWLRNPLPYLAEVASQYPLAFQTEGQPLFPPVLCCGFMSVRRSERSVAFLDALLAQSGDPGDGSRFDDQDACNLIIARDPTWLKDIYLLPEALFVNGLSFRTMRHELTPIDAMEGELRPFLFHANWTIGLDNKKKLLAMAHCWSVDGPGEAEDGPLISVLYPIFDVRGDAADHVGQWIERQHGIAAHRFQVIVAAPAEIPIDEASLRNVLRSFDTLIRVPHARQDTELWNAAAGAAKAPWLLFVEAHGWPDSDALAALAQWIAANPDKRACNFRIRNPDSYRIARLMKRWFTQMHQDWAQPTSWQRLHRTAFALRRDVFDRLGPIGPFGQFGPPLLSARLHQHGIEISTLPTSGLVHEDAADFSVHIEDTTNHVRGELAARAALADADAEFFESYFGPSPFHGARPILPAAAAWKLFRGLRTAASREERDAGGLRTQARRLAPSLLPLWLRRTWLLARIKLDAFLIMRLPVSRAWAWKAFTASHDHIVHAEQMRWMRDNPLPPVRATRAIPAPELVRHAIIGLHALEYAEGMPLRWSHPACLLRLAAGRRTTVRIDTRNLRPGLAAGQLQAVMIGGKDVAIDITPSGEIVLRAETPSNSSGIADLVLIAPELVEPGTADQPGRRLGLPLVELRIEFA